MVLESPILRDGDIGFIGYSSRLNPASLPAGMLQISENMRLDRGVAVTRKGVKRLADNIVPAGTPLTVPFVLSDPAPIVQSVYTGGIFGSAVVRSPDEANSIEAVVLAGADRAYLYLPEGLTTSEAWTDGVLAVDGTDNLVTNTGDEIVISRFVQISYPATPNETIDPTDKVSLVQAFDRLYLFREADAAQSGYETKYTTASGITVSGSTATVNVTAHGYPQGATIRIDGSTAPAFTGFEYRVLGTNLNANSFEITVPSGTTPDASANIKIRRVKPPLYWDMSPTTGFVRAETGIPDVGITYRRLRSSPWASYINNRLVIPDGKQNVMLSDVLDPDVFDPFWQSFRIGVGGNDKVMAVHPWVDGTFLVFCRKSIWIASVNQFAATNGSDFEVDTAISKIELLTDEIGCAARRTIQTAGQYVYFLSDAGVYRLDSRLDLKLRGDTKPLSDPIANQLENLNAALVENSVGLYFNNRYYLAVPLSSPSTGNNNGVFLYSQLNEAWETKDVYGFCVDNFLVVDVSGQRRVLVSNQAGKLMLLDEVEAGDQSADSTVDVTTPVAGRIVTRRYGFGSMSTKRFLRSVSDVVLPDTSAITVGATLFNPDSSLSLVPAQTNTSGLAEDYTLKNPIRQKAHYCELEFLTTANRPEIRNVSIEAAAASAPQTETRHVA
jgi:hypothetical protein